MTRPYQQNGLSLLVAGDGLTVRGTPDDAAGSGRMDWPQATAPRREPGRGAGRESGLDPRHAPDLLVGRRDLSQQAHLRSATVKVNRAWVFLRLLRLLFFGICFWAGVLWNRVLIKNAEERQLVDAKRFRRLLTYLGGVLIKVGQQLSQRPDVLPAAYCDELKALLDNLETKIDRADVLAAIERQTGETLGEAFAEFDFDAVGSASVSCVYRAVLHTGEEVAVKVRRPQILKEFTADLRAINWLLFCFEFLTIWRPGTTKNIGNELRDVLLEELDFRREARNQELFRRYLKRRKKMNVTAPKVFYKLSGEEVMVSEFVRGHKVQDIIEAIEKRDDGYLEELRHSGINPKTVAKRLLRSRYYSFHECPLFHGDPHPSNILVQANNKIVMMDFGACGVFSQRDRNLMWQMNHYYSRDDVGGMVNMVLLLMEPIYPINIHPFRRELLDAWWTGFYGIKSHHAQWWERTSFRLWLRFFELIRKYQVPIPRNMVRMIRATLLYDTVAARLYPEINVFKEFEKYSEGVARRARRQIEESAIRQLLTGPDDSNFLRFRQIVDLGDDILFRVRKFLDTEDFTFQRLAGKVYSTVRAIIRMFLLSVGAALIATLVIAVLYLTNRVQGWNPLRAFDGNFILRESTWNLDVLYQRGALQIIVLIWGVITLGLMLAYGRRIYLRYGDVDD